MTIPYTRSQLLIRSNERVKVRYDQKYERMRDALYYICQIGFSIGIWYTFSIVATIMNKTLVNKKIFPLTLTFAHVFTSCICDILVIYGYERQVPKVVNTKSGWKLFWLVLPLSCAMVFSKIFTYTSYGYVPVSLTHTVKALQPFFTVLITYFWTGKTVSWRTLLSLVPIIIGVAYASVNELQFNMTGFICALISCILSVWQSIYVKMLIKSGIDRNYLHLLNGIMSASLLFPIVIIYEIYEGTYSSLSLRVLLLCSIIQYCSSVASYKSISLITSLTYSITNTFKRIAIILATSLYFGKYLSFQTIIGIIIAMLGVLSYNLVKIKEQKQNKYVKSPLMTPNESVEINFDKIYI
ncbi:hypothetical protein WA158_001506 [Blastocystis sp. Blastoise]